MSKSLAVFLVLLATGGIGYCIYKAFKKPGTVAGDQDMIVDSPNSPLVVQSSASTQLVNRKTAIGVKAQHVLGSVRRAGITDAQWLDEQIAASKLVGSGRG